MKMQNRYVMPVGRNTQVFFQAYACGLLLKLFALAVFAIVFSGCSHRAADDVAERSAFEFSHVTVKKGEVVVNHVMNASEVAVVAAPVFIDATEDECSVSIRGLSAGDGELWVSADGIRVRCRVTVIDASDPNDTPKPGDDVVSMLSDGSTRFVCGEEVLMFSEPGNMFVLSADGKTLSVYSLATGAEIIFRSGMALTKGAAQVMSDPVMMPDASFEINGVGKSLESACIMQHKDGVIWVRLVYKDGVPVWIVVPDDFADS